MNIQVIAEHSVDLDLLPEKANILDLGCRGFHFANHFLSFGHRVITVDCDPKITPIVDHYKLAISNFDGLASVLYDIDPQATRIIPYTERIKGSKNPFLTLVECKTLKSFSEMVEIEFWDCIKMDVESSEYEIIMSLDKAPATQISCEFHLHTGLYDVDKVWDMKDKLESLGYNPVKHEMSEQHGLGPNYWDSLFILME